MARKTETEMLSVEFDIREAVKGFEALHNPRDQRETMKKVRKAGANIIRLEAYERAPVWKPAEPHHKKYRQARHGRHYGGQLKRTLKTQRSGLFLSRRGNAFVVAGGEVKYVPYAHLVEFGHEGPRPAPPHPFMAPAARAAKDKAKDKAVEVFLHEVGERLRKAHLRRSGLA